MVVVMRAILRLVSLTSGRCNETILWLVSLTCGRCNEGNSMVGFTP